MKTTKLISHDEMYEVLAAADRFRSCDPADESLYANKAARAMPKIIKQFAVIRAALQQRAINESRRLLDVDVKKSPKEVMLAWGIEEE